MITAKNYVAQAEQYLRKAKNIEPVIVQTTLDIINNSQHFAIHDGGKLLNDKIKGLVNVSLNLPFDRITVEYFYPNAAISKNVIFASQDENYIYLSCAGYFTEHDDWQFSKSIITVNRSTVCDDNGIKYDVMFPENLDEYYSEERLLLEERFNKSVSFSIFELLEALTCRNVYTQSLDPVDESKNRKRIAKGKMPLYETKILVVDSTPKEIDTEWKGGTHASPRQHLRRGHIRRYSWGNIWINNTLVGKATNGIVEKSYVVK